MNKIHKAGLALIRDWKVLLAKEYGTDKFFIPGGTLEQGEDSLQALMREVKEELGIELEKNDIEFLGSYEDKATLEPDTLIHMDLYRSYTKKLPKPSGEIEKLEWFGAKDDWNNVGTVGRVKVKPDLIKRGLLK